MKLFTKSGTSPAVAHVLREGGENTITLAPIRGDSCSLALSDREVIELRDQLNAIIEERSNESR